MDYNINFPNLNIFLEKVGKSISIGGFTIAFYGMIIAVGMVTGIILACYMAKKTGQSAELYTDLAMIAIICSALGARIYYVIFKWDYYKDIFEDGDRHFYEKEEISDWLLVHGLSEEKAKVEAAWLTLVDHGCIVIRNFNEVYFISK